MLPKIIKNCNIVDKVSTTMPKKREKSTDETILNYELHKRQNVIILPKYKLCSENKREAVANCGKDLWLEKYQHKVELNELKNKEVKYEKSSVNYRCK